VTESGHIEIVGIVSWGVGCGSPNYFGVYTRVFTYVDWIVQQIQVNPVKFCNNNNVRLKLISGLICS
jgi:secreted trypsin-like serine protease